jgi:hypothetical protein
MNHDKWNRMTDAERWKWLQAHQGEGYVVYLDNGDTFMLYQYDEETYDFDNYIGWSDGVVTLMEVMEIECELV